jgi:hypothetical protein
VVVVGFVFMVFMIVGVLSDSIYIWVHAARFLWGLVGLTVLGVFIVVLRLL